MIFMIKSNTKILSLEADTHTELSKMIQDKIKTQDKEQIEFRDIQIISSKDTFIAFLFYIKIDYFKES